VMNSYFDCNNIGELKEYVGCKIKKRKNESQILIVQPITIRSFIDKFGIQGNNKIEIPVLSNDYFSPVMDGDELDKGDQKGYQSGVVVRWSSPDILNITQELPRNFMKANQANLKAMKKVMTLCVNTKEHGIFVDPKGDWNRKAHPKI
jgi:hypothetical protein